MSRKQTKETTTEEAANIFKETLTKAATEHAKGLFMSYKAFCGVLNVLKQITTPDDMPDFYYTPNLDLLYNAEKQFSAYFTAHMLTYSFDSEGIEIFEQSNKMVLEFIENFKNYNIKVLQEPVEEKTMKKQITIKKPTNEYKKSFIELVIHQAEILFVAYNLLGSLLTSLKQIKKVSKKVSDPSLFYIIPNLDILLSNAEKQFSAYFTAHMLTYSFDSKRIKILKEGHKMVLEFIENFKKYYTKVLCEPKLLNNSKV